MPDAKDYAGNMATGAATGAVAGSVVPGVGTALGAGGGALLGLGYTALGGGSLLGLMSGGNVDSGKYLGPQNQLRGAQGQALNTVGNWAMTGTGPSAAQSMFQQNREQNNQAAVGSAKAMAGGNPALQANLMSNMLAKNNAQSSYQGSQLRAQEQQQQMDNYLRGLQAAREADIDVYKSRQAVNVHNADAKGGFLRGLMGGATGGLGGLF